MAIETELKLQLHSSDLDRLRTHPLLLAGTAGGTRLLLNTYYDSPDLQLAGARVALRLRRQGDSVIQTLKTRGQSINGLHQRGEWEWEVPRAELETDRLQASCWPAELPPADQLRLQPVFSTDFERELWHVDYHQARIEVALDIGHIRCDCPEGGTRQDSILELELELESGEASALWALAEELGRSLKLQPFDASKAQRGYQLFQQCQQVE
ncbi:CYTH domain-containing protein [Marinobacterium marinum]|uniref:CYTH domain-containing protein n=1 Tax=Marinobacterium marinum TaxID=2756129 RepID=A0A7W1X0H6_9GAMM|nr:CYTH domain-containing protein [Marinobacterium marinum]MBA4503630.1 CYTH domain-containing protein [Marinobacterium marinum]